MTSKQVEQKIDLVINKLVDLKTVSVEDSNTSDENLKIGLYPRDFGINIWDWPQGVGIYGFHRYENFKMYDNYIKGWFEERIAEGLPPKNVNTTAPVLTLIDYEEENEMFKKICSDWAKFLVEELQKTPEEVFQHVTSNVTGDGLILNEGQIWIDTIFMAVLFLNKYGKKHNIEEYRDIAKYQVLEHIKYLYNPKDRLFYHAYNFNDNTNFGEVYWNRGNSWFTYGIIDFLEMCDDEPKYFKDFVLGIYKNQVDKLLTIQDRESGLWHTVLDDDSSYLESSGSAAIAAAILKGIRLEILDHDTYISSALNAVKGIINCIDENGTVHKVSGGTGVGNDKEHYKNIIVTPIAYGQSLTIIALNEYYIYLKNKGE